MELRFPIWSWLVRDFSPILSTLNRLFADDCRQYFQFLLYGFKFVQNSILNFTLIFTWLRLTCSLRSFSKVQKPSPSPNFLSCNHLECYLVVVGAYGISLLTCDVLQSMVLLATACFLIILFANLKKKTGSYKLLRYKRRKGDKNKKEKM